MFKTVIIFFAVLFGAMVFLHSSLENGTAVKYLDDHPDPRWVPKADYYIGQGYYLFHDLDEATTFFMRVVEKYPDSRYSEDAYFNYLQCLDDMTTISRIDLMEENQKYLERFPDGKHASMVQNRVDTLKSNSR